MLVGVSLVPGANDLQEMIEAPAQRTPLERLKCPKSCRANRAVRRSNLHIREGTAAGVLQPEGSQETVVLHVGDVAILLIGRRNFDKGGEKNMSKVAFAEQHSLATKHDAEPVLMDVLGIVSHIGASWAGGH